MNASPSHRVALRRDGDIVAEGELDAVPVEHRHQAILGVAGERGRLSALKDRRAVGRIDDQLGLVDQGRVFRLGLGVFLVDQEERDDPRVAEGAYCALDMHPLLGLGRPDDR